MKPTIEPKTTFNRPGPRITPRERVIQFFIKTREQSGLSQAKFAEKIGCHSQTIVQIEAGTNCPSFELLDKLEIAFGIKF